MLLAAALAAGLQTGAALAQTALPPQAIDIPAGSLAQALDRLGEQTGVLITYEPGLTQGLSAPRVSGRYPPSEALRRLLRGSGIEMEAVNDRTFVLRRAPKTGTAPSAGASKPDRPVLDALEEAEVRDLKTVTVTGTRIRGVHASTAPVIRFDREAIESSGYSTTQDFFESLPQAFGGGPMGTSEDGRVGEGTGRATNFTAATGINLRGLGANSTLVLLNGRRMAPSQFGQALDVSLLPLSAIGGVDVLTDGASALYGSDAVAGVVNIFVRDDIDGAETFLRAGGTSEGGRSEQTVSHAYGKHWGSGSLLASVQYQDLGGLRSVQRERTSGHPMPTDVLPETTTYSGVFTLEQSISKNVAFSAQGFLATKDIHRKNRAVSYEQTIGSETTNTSLSAGLTIDLANDWRASATLIYGRDNGKMVERQFYPSTSALNLTEQDNVFESVGAEVVLDGALLNLPGGKVRAAVGASYREDSFHQDGRIGAVSISRSTGTNVSALFGEFNVPIIGERNAVAGIRALDLALALRHDNYDSFGGTTNPRFGLLYAPTQNLRLRASYSRSFRAPNTMEQFISAFVPGLVGIAMDSPNGSGTVPGFILQGSRDVGPERASSLAWGFDWDAPFWDGLTLSFTRYDLVYRDRIFLPAWDTGALRQPEVYGALISTIADDAAAQSIIDGIMAQGGGFYDYNGGGAAGVRHLYDQRQLNASRLEQSGYDVTAVQRFYFDPGALTLHLNASYIGKIDTQLVQGAEFADYAGTYGFPTDLRLRVGANWSTDRWSFNVGVNHVDDYVDRTQAVPHGIDSWTTVDISSRVRIGTKLGLPLDKLQLGLSVQNLFNSPPPYVVSHTPFSVNYDPGNASPLGRFLSVELRLGW